MIGSDMSLSSNLSVQLAVQRAYIYSHKRFEGVSAPNYFRCLARLLGLLGPVWEEGEGLGGSG